MAQGEWKSTRRLIDAAIAVLEQEHPMTIRQLFYRLVSTTVIDNCLGDYQRVSKAMTKARDDKRVPYAWIVDRSRATYTSRGWQNLAQLGEVLERECLNYRRDYWQDQPNHVEIWCEKDAVTGSIEEVREEYGLTVEAIRGFNSTTNVQRAATRLLHKKQEGKHITIFYLGDWDPSGKDIERDLVDRLQSYELTGVRLHDMRLQRLAIFKSDIEIFNLPALKVKPSDPRASGFKRDHGNHAVELDALPPTELRARLRKAINEAIDHVAWNRALVVEEAQRETSQRYAGVIKQMIAAG
ncbi:MAG: hypothetical protein ACHP7P_12005 [Terriglobales bacterium]